ncbi:ROK family transcriptional regulator [Cellulomonas sp. WB94]|uniref:ROK family transcriptional regulator n=1 Tax=Cellulomonas sp. WB94 TaxID=2173174 RepID=UPI001F5B7C8C|nr:ROK family transcriptional regulator [Cellulomonas sp. WB94]
MDTATGADGGPARQPGSQTALRSLNVQRVVGMLTTAGASTQAELARHTGLSTATVSSIVRAMVGRGIVTTSPTTSSGRRAVLVRLEDRGIVPVGIDLGRTHVRVCLATLGYEVIAERSVALPHERRPHEGIDMATGLLADLLAESSVPRSAVVGVGVGIPGPIDNRTGHVLEGPLWPEWDDLDPQLALEERLGVPVFLDNDANLGALAEVTWGPHSSVDNLVFLKLGSGIGCGLIVGGQPYHGHVGIAGEIGHSPISDTGPLCRCGNRGCLEMAASTSTMIDLLDRGQVPRLTTDDIVRQALAGDTATLRVIEDAGVATGRALASVVNLINPEVVVVGGPLAVLGEILLEPIRRGLLRYAIAVAGQTTRLAVSSLGDRAEALGAAALVLRHPVLG